MVSCPGRQLADSVRDAFATGLNHAMTAGAVIAILTAGFTLWRAPRRNETELPFDQHVLEDDQLAGVR